MRFLRNVGIWIGAGLLCVGIQRFAPYLPMTPDEIGIVTGLAAATALGFAALFTFRPPESVSPPDARSPDF